MPTAARKRAASQGAARPGAAPSSSPDLSATIAEAVAAAMGPVMQEMQELRQQVQQVPRFKPMERQDGLTDRFHGVKKGEQKNGTGDRLLQGSDSHAVPDYIMHAHPNRFEADDQVRLNPDAVKDGSERTWGDILEGTRSDGYGRVLRVDYFSKKSGKWKYHVLFPGLTTRMGDGFNEEELLPA